MFCKFNENPSIWRHFLSIGRIIKWLKVWWWWKSLYYFHSDFRALFLVFLLSINLLFLSPHSGSTCNLLVLFSLFIFFLRTIIIFLRFFLSFFFFFQFFFLSFFCFLFVLFFLFVFPDHGVKVMTVHGRDVMFPLRPVVHKHFNACYVHCFRR